MYDAYPVQLVMRYYRTRGHVVDSKIWDEMNKSVGRRRQGTPWSASSLDDVTTILDDLDLEVCAGRRGLIIRHRRVKCRHWITRLTQTEIQVAIVLGFLIAGAIITWI